MGKSNAMKNIKEIIKEHTSYKLPGKELYDEQQVEQMLKEYGTMVVDECYEQAEITPDDWTDGRYIIEESIMRVKDSIK